MMLHVRAEGKAHACSSCQAAAAVGSRPRSVLSAALAASGSSSRRRQRGGRARLATAAAAASSPPGGGAAAAADDDAEAVRLATAAAILALSPSSSSSSDDAGGSLASSLHSPPSGSPAAGSDGSLPAAPLPPAAAAAGAAGDDGAADAAARSVLEEITVLDADSLSLAVGILRQRQPLEAGDEAGVQLSERLRDLLLLLRSRPGGEPDAAAAAGAGDGLDAFWAPQDEWADVRSALMSIGINASLDEDDEEGVWTLEAGELQARRTRLLHSLPKLDCDTAAELAAFLAELQQRHAAAPPAGHGQQEPQPAAAAGSDGALAPAQQRAQQHVAVSKEQEQWWQQAELAYSLLQQQANATQDSARPQEGQPQEAEEANAA